MATTTKKKQRAPSVKQPAKEQFPVVVLAREYIADCLNDQIAAQRSGVKRFTSTDPRLTSRVCRQFCAQVLDELINGEGLDSSESEAAANMLDELDEG